MPIMAELFSKKGRKLLMVGKLSIIAAQYERLKPEEKPKYYIKFDNKIYLDKDIERLRDKCPELF